jgi:hypothetical protein
MPRRLTANSLRCASGFFGRRSEPADCHPDPCFAMLFLVRTRFSV